MTDFPARNQQAPAYWDQQLQAYIDERVTPPAERVSPGTVEANLTETAVTANLTPAAVESKLPARLSVESLNAFATDVDLSNHAGNTNNPHAVTKAQVGLGNVDNTADANKPVSTAQAAADTSVLNASAPLIAGGSELREQFWTMSDGAPPSTSATRQAMTNFSPFATAAPYVRNGFLSTASPPSAEGGAYRIAQLTGPVLRVGARFAFTPYTLSGGLLCLSIQATSIATNPSVPVSPMHFYIDPVSWTMDVNDTAGTAVENVASGNLRTALTADSATLYTVEVVLDRDRQQAHIILPDGSVVTLTDSRFALPGTFVYVEPYKSLTSPASKTDALVREWWADSRTVETLPNIRARATTPWTAPTLTNSWVNFGAPHQVAQYRKVGDRVEVRGLIKSGTVGSAALTLPAGFRPPADLFFPTVANGAYGHYTITAGGALIPSSGSNAFFAINCSFAI